MFLVKDDRFQPPNLVFVERDPRDDGYTGEIVDDVSLDYDELKVHRWDDGQRRPEACVGIAPDNSKHYRVFKYSDQLHAAGFEPVAGTPIASFASWFEYIRISLSPPKPNQTSEVNWYDYLDTVDEASREWRKSEQSSDPPAGADRDFIAAWLAKKHFIADSAIREVWYLPKNAPQDEIRLLELSDRLAGNESRVDPLDFGLDIDGANFRLMVADVTTDQMEQIKQNRQQLPPGWSLDGTTMWRRRGA
jgi:hypothetical protein